MKIHSSALVFVALFLSAVTAFATINPVLQMQTGNPSAAATNPVVNRTNFLIQRAQDAFSYNDTTREPNWVAWNLTSGDVGSSGRSPDFFQDTTLPAGFYPVLPTDYSGSGYDRGHLCPSGDRTVTRADNDVVFFMSNIMPQAPDNNQGVWASFETYCRTLADTGNEVLIIAGPGGFAGSTIASGVSIPAFTWKIAVVVPLGAGTALSRITATTRVIAIKIPNTAVVRSNPWQQYVTSAAQLQTDTGYTFFTDPALSSVAATLRAQVDGLTATGAPTITTPPSTQTTAVGGGARFSVTATSNPAATLTYQWLHNDDPITGNASATTATLTLTNVQAADAAIYTVVVTNPIGSITSAGAALVITGLPPVIATSPASLTKVAGTTAVFTVSATGSPTLAYQWRKGGNNLTNTANITGATSATLTIANVQAADAATYDVVVANPTLPNATSAGATLTVTPAAPTIILPPTTQTAVVGNLTTFTVAATGTAPFTYQWRKGGTLLTNGVTGTGATLAGATTATLTVTNTQLADAGNFNVVVSNGLNPEATSAVAILTVSAVASPSTVAWNFGAGAGTESGAPTSGLPADVTGGTVTSGNNNGTTTLVTAVSVSNTYSGFSAGNNAGAAARIGALNTATAGSAFFEFTLTPTANKPLSVSAFTFGTRSTSTGPQAYSIFSNADNYTTAVATGTLSANSVWALQSPVFTAVTGTTGAALTFRIYGHSGAGSPAVNTANWRIDDLKVTLTTAANAPLIPAVTATTPAAATAVAGKIPITVTFNQSVAVATGWFTINSALNGGIAATVTGGPTTYTFTPPVNFADNDTVTVTIVAAQITDTATNTLHPAANTVFTFTTGAAIAPTIATAPTAQTANAGTRATFTVVASGTAPLTYQWRKNAMNIAGNDSANTATLILPNVQANDDAGYDVVVTNPVRAVISSLARLTVNPTATAPVFTRQPGNVVALAGRSAAFTVVATGSPAPTYQWFKHGIALSGATTATLTLTNVTTADVDNYAVTVTNSAGTVTSSTVTLRVIARSYAGTYIGTIPASGGPGGSSGGAFALLVNDENSGVLLAFERIAPFLDDLPSGGYFAHTVTSTAQGFAISDSGAFDFTAAAYRPAAASTGGVMPLPSPPNTTTSGLMIRPVSVTGSISERGALTGLLAGSSSLSAQKSPDTGSTAGYAGFYTAGSSSNSAQLLAIVSPTGPAVVVVLSNDNPIAGAPASSVEGGGRNRLAMVLPDRTFGVDAGTGIVDSLGRLSITTPTSQVLVLALTPDTGGINAAVTTAAGATTTFTGFAATSAALAQQRIVNLSTRTTAGSGDQVAIVGFVITGLESKPVLLRAVGPALRGLGVTTALAAPRLELRANGVLLATNNGWTTTGNAAEIANAAARSGAFPLAAGSADSVILTTLAPGTYTALMSASDARPGVGLIEIYDLSAGSLAQKLSNLSIRAAVGTGEGTLISGLVVGGSAPKRVLIRAAGPSLTQFGVTGALPRPTLSLFSATGAVLAQNSGWSTSADAASIVDAAARVGAFVFGATSADAALILNLPSGAYTAQVTGVAGATGTALLEVYELP